MPRASKHCGRFGCHELVRGRTYCAQHTAEVAARANTTGRGYGKVHQQARRDAIEALRPGTPCPRCSEPMQPDQHLDLDHTDDRAGYLGLAHRWCNRRAGAASRRGGQAPPRQPPR